MSEASFAGFMAGDAWQALADLPAWSLTEIPRDAPAGPSRRAQALAAAYRVGEPVAFGWVRERAGGPVRVIVAGPGLAAPDGGAPDRAGRPVPAGMSPDLRAGMPTTLTLPFGARGVPLGAGGAAAAFGAVRCWTPIALIAEPLLIADRLHTTDGRDQGEDGPRESPLLEDGLVAGAGGPFGWLVLAVPIPGGRVRKLIEEVSGAELAAGPCESLGAHLAAFRALRRNLEYRQAVATGLWDIRLLAGGASSVAAGQVASVLCASASLDGLPYAVAQLDIFASLARMLDGGSAALIAGALPPRALSGAGSQSVLGDDYPEPGPEFPCAGSTRLLGVLARPPAREIPGLRFVLRPEFDVTPETAVVPGPASWHGSAGALPGPARVR